MHNIILIISCFSYIYKYKIHFKFDKINCGLCFYLFLEYKEKQNKTNENMKKYDKKTTRNKIE